MTDTIPHSTSVPDDSFLPWKDKDVVLLHPRTIPASLTGVFLRSWLLRHVCERVPFLDKAILRNEVGNEWKITRKKSGLHVADSPVIGYGQYGSSTVIWIKYDVMDAYLLSFPRTISLSSEFEVEADVCSILRPGYVSLSFKTVGKCEGVDGNASLVWKGESSPLPSDTSVGKEGRRVSRMTLRSPPPSSFLSSSVDGSLFSASNKGPVLTPVLEVKDDVGETFLWKSLPDVVVVSDPYQEPLPSLRRVKPTSGKKGSEVWIFGSGFDLHTRVLFDGVESLVHEQTEDLIMCTVPESVKEGYVSLTLSTPSGSVRGSTFQVKERVVIKLEEEEECVIKTESKV